MVIRGNVVCNIYPVRLRQNVFHPLRKEVMRVVLTEVKQTNWRVLTAGFAQLMIYCVCPDLLEGGAAPVSKVTEFGSDGGWRGWEREFCKCYEVMGIIPFSNNINISLNQIKWFLRTDVELPFQRWEQTERPARFKNPGDYCWLWKIHTYIAVCLIPYRRKLACDLFKTVFVPRSKQSFRL